MNPILQDKLLDLLVNFIAIILGGGLITLAIEWRRHKREVLNWQREDETIQIDIPVARMHRSKWLIDEKTPDKDKLMIYENRLENSTRQLIIYAEFVIRNTTPAEIIVTDYDMVLLNIPHGANKLDFYDLETFDPISPKEMGAIRLKPYGTIPRALVFFANFGKDRRLDVDYLPTSMTISVTTSSGKVIQRSAELNQLPGSQGLVWHINKFVPTKYRQKVTKNDEEVPF